MAMAAAYDYRSGQKDALRLVLDKTPRKIGVDSVKLALGMRSLATLLTLGLLYHHPQRDTG